MNNAVTDAMVADMDETSSPTTPVAAARALGLAAAAGAQFAAEHDDPLFGARALAFIVNHVREKGAVPGESITLAATASGIRPKKGDRAFGAIYAKALRKKYIQVHAYVPRIRGHGTSGGKLYVPGENKEPVEFPA
jgi:hypothetical protein